MQFSALMHGRQFNTRNQPNNPITVTPLTVPQHRWQIMIGDGQG
jgi:hypothetical protein